MLTMLRNRRTSGPRQTSLRTPAVNVLSLLGVFALFCSLAGAQDDKRATSASPKPQTKAEECAPADTAQKAASRPSQISEQATKAETAASEESENQDPLASKLRSGVSSVEDREDTLALLDCSKEPDASSAGCLKKRSKLDPNQCERTEADNDLKLHSHE